MTNPTDSHWVVLKFGGTSVSSVSNWKNVAAVVRARLDEGLRPVVVHSALSGITDRLEQLLAAVERSLAAFGALGYRLRLSKQVTDSVRIDAGIEYYNRRVGLALNSTDNTDAADYDFLTFNLGWKVSF